MLFKPRKNNTTANPAPAAAAADSGITDNALTQDVYFASRPLAVQRALLYNNPVTRRAKFLDVMKYLPGYPVDGEIDVLGYDAYTIMAKRAQAGFTNGYPSEQEGIPWNIDPVTNQLRCTQPNDPMPGVPTYEQYTTEHGPFAIKVSVNASDYPANSEQFHWMTIQEFHEGMTKLNALAGQCPQLETLNSIHAYNILIPDGQDADQLDTMEDGFPSLSDYRLRANDRVRFAYVLNLGGGLKAYWAEDVLDALDKGPQAVLALKASL